MGLVYGRRAAVSSQKTDIKYHSSSRADEDLTDICLCQPEPKIPRPRNGKQSSAFVDFPLSKCSCRYTDTYLLLAFILYRQHRQAQVAAQNPKLSNPEISKVIGELWRKEPEPVKDQWKAVADVRRFYQKLI